VAAKRDFRRREGRNLGLRHKPMHDGNRRAEALLYLGLIRAANQPGVYVAAIENIHWPTLITAFVKFVEFPLRSELVKMGHALMRQS
jgi:hypothetical protein